MFGGGPSSIGKDTFGVDSSSIRKYMFGGGP